MKYRWPNAARSSFKRLPQFHFTRSSRSRLYRRKLSGCLWRIPRSALVVLAKQEAASISLNRILFADEPADEGRRCEPRENRSPQVRGRRSARTHLSHFFSACPPRATALPLSCQHTTLHTGFSKSARGNRMACAYFLKWIVTNVLTIRSADFPF